MRTAVDSSVLLDVLSAQPPFAELSREALRRAYDGGALLACDVVWAEVRAHFGDDAPFVESLRTLGVRFEPIAGETAQLSGSLWRRFRLQASPRRERIVADFLVGAHALTQADRLLTRDRGFYHTYFASLEIIDPAHT